MALDFFFFGFSNRSFCKALEQMGMRIVGIESLSDLLASSLIELGLKEETSAIGYHMRHIFCYF